MNRFKTKMTNTLGLIGCTGVLLSGACTSTSKTESSPNIILFLVDDMAGPTPRFLLAKLQRQTINTRKHQIWS